MIRGLYSGAAGLRTQATRMSIMGNNLSNSSTPGFKQDVASVGPFPRLLLSRLVDGGQVAARVGAVGTGAGLREVSLDLHQGMLAESGKDLDLALDGAGFFALQAPDGVRYTRAGSFSRDADGQLSSSHGYPVLGEGGPILLPNGPVRVQTDGTVYVGEERVSRVQVIDFPAGTQFRKTGSDLLQADGGTEVTTANVRQFSLEASNVDPVNLMVDLMSASRAYESSQRLLQIQDQTLERAVNDVGRVG